MTEQQSITCKCQLQDIGTLDFPPTSFESSSKMLSFGDLVENSLSVSIEGAFDCKRLI